MEFYNIPVAEYTKPPLDDQYLPLESFFRGYEAVATEPFAVAVERAGGATSVYETKICGPEYHQANVYYIDRLVKFLLWSRGGYKVYLCGDKALSGEVAKAYAVGGSRDFDRDFMARVYESEFQVVLCDYTECPRQKETAKALGGHLAGCRIGFDAGGSDRKVSAVVDGQSIYSEEVVWHPKTQSDPQYHFDGIVDAMKTAASKMPRVDGIGVSSAGVFVEDRCMVASLFLQVPQDVFDQKVKDIFTRAAAEIGPDIPVSVCNDGDVTALAGAMSLEETGILGIAMGTSEAAGYVDMDGCITGWLNELAFAPVDCQPEAMMDEWSGDIGCGVKYFSQDGAIRLAGLGGMELHTATPGEKLKEIQAKMAEHDQVAQQIFEAIGVCLGHTLALYCRFYNLKHVLVLGRVMSGLGGDVILEKANSTLAVDYPEIQITVQTPDEKARRVGQSVAAASLPSLSS